MGHYSKQLILILLCFSTGILHAQYRRNQQTIIVAKTSDLTGRVADTGQVAIPLDIGFPYIYNGANWMPSSRSVTYKGTVVVTGTATGSTAVLTLPSSPSKFYPLQITFRASNISGVTTQPTVSIGSNSTTYNNIVTASLLNTILSTIGANSGAPQNASVSPPLAGGTAIYAKVTIAAVATNYTFTVDITGFYDNN